MAYRILPLLVFASIMIAGCERAPGTAAAARMVPTFRVDPDWPSVPTQWRLGDVSSVAIDADDNAWLLHRPRTLSAEEIAMAAPPVIGFDRDGAFLRAWGGVGDGYEWPQREHGIHIDHQGYVWLGGNNCPGRVAGLEAVADDQLLKFTLDGEFVMQIGRSSASRGNGDTANFHEPADAVLYPPTNELFVADGYVNRRVIVFDADAGTFKRMWGAYGNRPDDSVPNTRRDEGPGSPQFNTVHGIAVSDDGYVYVADRLNNRVQVFTLDGTFQREVFIERPTRLLGTAFSVAFSEDQSQRHLFVADAGNGRVHILDRQTLDTVSRFGRIGRYAGQFVFLHNVAVDSRGNVYTSEVGGGRRAQKFVRR